MKKLVVPVIAIAVLAAAMYSQSTAPAAVVCDPPDVGLGEIPGLQSVDLGISESEYEMLPKDTRVEKWRYIDDFGHWYVVNLVVGGKHKGSIHRPELCLPAQGNLMANPHDIDVGGETWHALRIEGGVDMPSFGFAYTFFNQDGYHTASHIRRIFRDVWDRSVYNRIDRWVMVTIASSHTDDAGIHSFVMVLKKTVLKGVK